MGSYPRTWINPTDRTGPDFADDSVVLSFLSADGVQEDLLHDGLARLAAP